MLIRRLFAVLALAGCCAMQALPQNTLPPRPPIFLNNNASLYTFPNPNFGKPSQLPFAFVAVAHEDCRLYHNGAMLMPKHRLLAAECIQANNMNGGGVIPIDPFNPFPPFPPFDPFDPFNPGQINGINYQRQRMAAAYAQAARMRYLQAQAAQAGGYQGYPTQPEAVLTTSASSESTSKTSSRSRHYRGFGSFREHRFGGFTTMLQPRDGREFGKGFDGEADKTPDAPKPAEQ